MYIKGAEIKDFRNYEAFKIDFHEKVNIITGKNAQGKTNILEAIFISSLGKSFRTSKDLEMIRFGCDFFRVKIESQKDGEDLTVEIVVSKEGKGIKIDGVRAVKNSELLEKIYIVIFSPEDLKIVKDEPEKRRKFIDRELCLIKPIYYENLAKYKKILKQRNAFLKEEKINVDLLDVWDKELSNYGARLIFERNFFIDKINRISKKIHFEISNEKENIEIIYDPSITYSSKDVFLKNMNDQKEEFYKELKNHHKSDTYRRTTTAGPHKDDIIIKINGTDIRSFGSQGQQRTAALSLKLAEINLIKEEKNESAILLLDDVLSELDRERQNYLIKSLSEVQLFITAADISEEVKSKLPQGKTFLVENGGIKEI